MGPVAGISMMKDEADVVGRVVAHMLEEVDFLLVADNGSTDGTREILDGMAGDRLRVVDDPEVAYMQSRKMTALAREAGDFGAEWVVPFDADEWWYSPFGRIGDVLLGIAPQWLTAPATVYDHVATAKDPEGLDPVARIGWRRFMPLPLRKVACRVRDDLVIHQGNHGATYDGGATEWPDQLVVRHFPYRSAEQFVSKARNGAAAYAAAGDALRPDDGKHWRDYGALLDAHGEEVLAGVFRAHFFEPFPEQRVELIYDPAP